MLFDDGTVWTTGALDNVVPNSPPSGSVTVNGTATQSQILTVTNTLADADGLGTITYQWQSSANGTSWSDIGGAMGIDLLLSEAQVGLQIRVRASYVDGRGVGETKTSAATTGVIYLNHAPSGDVTINGTTIQNQTLQVANTLADSDGLGTVVYQWQSSADSNNWNNLGGSVGSSLTLSEAQVGMHIRVLASYVDGHGFNETKASSATESIVNVNDLPIGEVTISGIARQNQTLTVSNRLVDADGLGPIGYRWQASIDGNIWSDIGGATAASYTLSDAQVGTLLRVQADYVDGHGTAERVVSSATTSVANANDIPLVLTGNAAANILLGGGGNDTINGGAGADTLIGGQGDDTYVVDNRGDTVVEATDEGSDSVISTVSYILTDNIENLTLTGVASISGTGNPLDNLLTGNAAANVLNGGEGIDTMIGGLGNDIYAVDDEDDVVIEEVGQGIDTIQSTVSYELGANLENLTLLGLDAIDGTGNEFNNILTGNVAANMLVGGGGNDTLNGGAGIDTLIGGLGNDTYMVDDVADVVVENVGEGTDTVQSTVSYTLGANLENLTLLGTDAVNGTGNDFNNVLIGNVAANILSGGAGNDTLNGGTGADTLIGHLGNDVYVIDDVADIVIENAGEGTDTVQSTLSYTLGANLENLTLLGTAAINGTGNDLNNVLTGNLAANILSGGIGNDTLNGRAGADTLIGHIGNDTYVVDDVADIEIENAGEGTDTVHSTVSYTLGANLENLTLLGTVAINGTGNELNNLLTGNAAANILSGGAGNDTLNGAAGADALVGGAGDDTYTVDNVGDTIVELADDGLDSVNSTASYMLSANVERLTLIGAASIDGTGNELNNLLTGNAAANILTGGAGNDTLNGGVGADTLNGGAGDDTYAVDNNGDVIVETTGEGIDTVNSTVSYVLADNIENLTLMGAAAIDGIGNVLGNVLTGNAAANVLNGGLGADTLIGGLGNDIYVVDDVNDVVIEELGQGTDTIQSTVSYEIGDNLENLTLLGTDAIAATGNGLNNVITGNISGNTFSGGVGNDTLNGGAGIDTLIGGLGNDIYVVDDLGDVVVENAGEGTDTVQSTVSYTLGVNVENLTLLGTDPINGTGNDLNNVLTGNVAANILAGGIGNDTLNGGVGADTLIGYLGNDTYVVDDTGDVVVESLGEGTDTVQSTLSYTLGSNLENLALLGTVAINGTGNELNNVLTGNIAANILSGGIGNDTLNGGAGTDILIGSLGNDVYVVDHVNDVVVENPEEGTDTVQSTVSYTLGANLENLTVLGAIAINGTGNELDNVLVGNAAANILSGEAGNDSLNGAAGADTLVGGTGDDTYMVDNVGDAIIELTNEGQDSVNSSVSYTLSANVERLTLTGTASIDGSGNAQDNTFTGNAATNILTGGAGNDTLNGGAGADTLIGGSGDDTYVADNSGDVVVEAAGEGADSVKASVSYVLADNIESLTLSGTAAINGTGNAGDNLLTGNAAANVLGGGTGNDTLDGGAGADTLIGGDGNDLYTVDNAADVVNENPNQGIDSVQSSVTYTLAPEVENLTLTGIGNTNGIGNGLDNTLRGTKGNNILTGYAGNDILDGLAGSDTLVGGIGNDTYVFGRGYAGDTLRENDATSGNIDIVQFLAGVSMDQIWLRHVGNNLEASIIGTQDKLTIENWYLGSAYHVEQFKTADGNLLLDSQVENLVQIMGVFAPPVIGQVVLPQSYQDALSATIAANWHTL